MKDLYISTEGLIIDKIKYISKISAEKLTYIFEVDTLKTVMAKIKEFKTPRGTLELHGVRGIVTNAGKTSTTRVSGGGSTSVSSYSTIRDQIFIIDKTGKEHVLQLDNWDFPAKNDHDISAYWLTKNGVPFTFYGDEYVYIFNHTLGKGLFRKDKHLKTVFHNGLAFLIPVAAIPALYWLFPFVSLFAFLFPKQKAATTISFDGTYSDNRLQVERNNTIADAEGTILKAVVFIVIVIAVIIVYNVVTNRKIRTGIAQMKQDIKESMSGGL